MPALCVIGRRAVLAISFLGLIVAMSPAHAQSADGRLRLIVPNQAGSGVDAVARAMTHSMATAFGRPIIIENLPGSGGMIGTQQIVHAPKDGSVLGMVSSNHVSLQRVSAASPAPPSVGGSREETAHLRCDTDAWLCDKTEARC